MPTPALTPWCDPPTWWNRSSALSNARRWKHRCSRSWTAPRVSPSPNPPSPDSPNWWHPTARRWAMPRAAHPASGSTGAPTNSSTPSSWWTAWPPRQRPTLSSTRARPLDPASRWATPSPCSPQAPPDSSPCRVLQPSVRWTVLPVPRCRCTHCQWPRNCSAHRAPTARSRWWPPTAHRRNRWWPTSPLCSRRAPKRSPEPNAPPRTKAPSPRHWAFSIPSYWPSPLWRWWWERSSSTTRSPSCWPSAPGNWPCCGPSAPAADRS